MIDETTLQEEFRVLLTQKDPSELALPSYSHQHNRNIGSIVSISNIFK